MPDKRRPSEIARILSVGAISTVLLFLGFFANYWGVAEEEWFDTRLHDSESYILGRLAKSRQDGILSAGGLTGLASLTSSRVSSSDRPFSIQYRAYTRSRPVGAYTTYNSQIGGQGMLFGVLDKWLTVTPEEKLTLFQAMNSLLSAVALTAIVLWFYLEFGLTAALFVLASAITSQWLAVFGRSLRWSLWALYLPVVVVMYYPAFRRVPLDINLSTFGVVVFVTVFIKCLFNGYEFITPTLAMMIVPLVYYSIVNRLNFRRFLAGLSTAAFSSCLAMLLAALILCVQVASAEGSFRAGLDHMAYVLEKRTSGNPGVVTPELAAASRESTYAVIRGRLNSTFFDGGKYLSNAGPVASRLLKVYYVHLVSLFVMTSAILYYLSNKVANDADKRKFRALIYTTWLSTLAPLSWFVIFRTYSAQHNWSSLAWHMPFVFFGCAVFGLVVKSLVSIVGRSRQVLNA